MKFQVLILHHSTIGKCMRECTFMCIQRANPRVEKLSGSWMTVEKWNVKQTERSKSCRRWKLCDSDRYSNFSLYFHALQVFQHLSDNWWGGWDHPSVQNWRQLGGTRLPGQLMTSNVSCVTKCPSCEALVESDWLFLYKGQIIHPDKLGPANFSASCYASFSIPYIKMGRRQDVSGQTNWCTFTASRMALSNKLGQDAII